MYQYTWDAETGGLLLTVEQSKFSKEPRPVYYKELDILGFDQHWNYPKDDHAPLLWAEANNYIYKGRTVARTKGGSLYTKPELILLEDPEPDGAPLQFVDIQAMCEKNTLLMDTLVQETVQKIYNTYTAYQNKVDIFHVSFSGGKDSVVTLDLVQRAVPHEDFVVIFGDTGMEFPDTYKVIEHTQQKCSNSGIDFYIAKSETDPLEHWHTIGPPASAIRWCCGVHKTAPQLFCLRNIVNKPDLIEMAFVGVRADESVRRSGYDYISLGTKQKGQYSCNPILDWNSAEVYLYIYTNNLDLNEAYKKGSARAGCLFCPMATEKSDFINHSMYPHEVDQYIEIIRDSYAPGHENPDLQFSYLNNKGWRARKNGRDLSITIPEYYEETIGQKRIVRIKSNGQPWQEWIKTVGNLVGANGNYQLQIKRDIVISFTVKIIKNYLEFAFDESICKRYPTDMKLLKNALKKSHACVACRYCEANCPHGNIKFPNGVVSVSDLCVKCGLCNNLDRGCIVLNSLILPKGTDRMKRSVGEYGTHPVQQEWLEQFVKYQEKFKEETNLNGPKVKMFTKFLKNAGVVDDGFKMSDLAKLLFRDGLKEEYIWALMLVNLSDDGQFGWLVQNLDFDTEYSRPEMAGMLESTGVSVGITTITNNYFKHYSQLQFSEIGFGKAVENINEEQVYMRTAWVNPIPEVLLYALYKFAEACDGYYQFSLATLMDNTIEREGISPTRIFGLNRDTMMSLLNGLSINYPEFINASFTLDLETITLREDKTAEDVLALF